MKLKIFQAMLIATTVFFTIQCSSSSAVSSQMQPTKTPPSNQAVNVVVGSNTKAVTGTSDSEPTDAAEEVNGEKRDSVITDLKLETILRQPLPEIWFVFPCQIKEDESNETCVDGKIRKEISPEVRTLAEKRWKDSLKAVYLELMKKFTSPQEMMNEEAIFINAGSKFKREVGELFIEAPNGNRNISGSEASQLLFFIGKTARETVQSAKEKLNE